MFGGYMSFSAWFLSVWLLGSEAEGVFFSQGVIGLLITIFFLLMYVRLVFGGWVALLSRVPMGMIILHLLNQVELYYHYWNHYPNVGLSSGNVAIMGLYVLGCVTRLLKIMFVMWASPFSIVSMASGSEAAGLVRRVFNAVGGVFKSNRQGTWSAGFWFTLTQTVKSVFGNGHFQEVASNVAREYIKHETEVSVETVSRWREERAYRNNSRKVLSWVEENGFMGPKPFNPAEFRTNVAPHVPIKMLEGAEVKQLEGAFNSSNEVALQGQINALPVTNAFNTVYSVNETVPVTPLAYMWTGADTGVVIHNRGKAVFASGFNHFMATKPLVGPVNVPANIGLGEVEIIQQGLAAVGELIA